MVSPCVNLLSRCVGVVGSFGGRICLIVFATPNANLPANSFALSAALFIRFLPVSVVVVPCLSSVNVWKEAAFVWSRGVPGFCFR